MPAVPLIYSSNPRRQLSKKTQQPSPGRRQSGAELSPQGGRIQDYFHFLSASRADGRFRVEESERGERRVVEGSERRKKNKKKDWAGGHNDLYCLRNCLCVWVLAKDAGLCRCVGMTSVCKRTVRERLEEE